MVTERPGAGLLSFIAYAFMPNHLGYCGGGDGDLLLEHAATGKSDPRLAPLLKKFTGAMPYLYEIAAANHIRDPFDERVVEAYWLGNELLDRVEAGALNRSIEERFGKQLPRTVRDHVLRKAPDGAMPFHLFHVVDVYRHLEPEEIGMAAMESCRVSWGEVTAIDGSTLTVLRSPLIVRPNHIALGEPRPELVTRAVGDVGFTSHAQVGDWVSIHWGWVCEVLDARKLANLRRYTGHHLTLASRTI